MKRATIDDVARLAGVSIKTVSRVLNHEPKVKPSTKGKILSAMETLKYRPNSSARRLAGNRTYLLGLIYNANSSYSSAIQNGVLNACKNEHYDLLIHPCNYKGGELLNEISDLLTGNRVDGVILTPPVSDLDSARAMVREADVPFVSISRPSVTDSGWTVGTNDLNISASVIDYLAGLGHQRIAFVLPNPDHHAMVNRFEGYKEGLERNGLPYEPSLVVQGDNSFDSGVECGQALIQRDGRPTAVFCANDNMAAGVLSAAHELGLKIPADISITGYDDIPMAEKVWPALTTVHQPMQAMAELAANLLIRRLRGETPDDANRILESRLVTRQSTGPAPA